MGKNLLNELTKANEQTWDERAAIHYRDATGFYAVDRFRAGEDILMPIESNEIGVVKGKKLLHLQCHIGLEALCLARRGAQVTGLDFSEVSIECAEMLASETNIKAQFIKTDLYHATQAVRHKFDIVYVSWGSLNWLPDIWAWGRVVANLLAKGGYLYMIEQHPFISVMKEQDGKMEPAFAFKTPINKPIVTKAPASYNEDQQTLLHGAMHEWQHSLSDIIMSLIDAGLRLEFVRDHEVLAWKFLPMMVLAPNRLYRLPDHHVRLPLSFSLKATKP